jgi:hypothetical protein
MKKASYEFATRSNDALLKQTVIPALLGLLLAAQPALADDDDDRPCRVIPFSAARILIEINATDGDSGLHAKLDAEGWRWVEIYDPRGKLIFHVMGGGGVRKTGLTELSFESAEPGFDELPLDEFLRRFPAGEYRFIGRTLEGDTLFSKATLTHALPDAPVLLSPPEDSVQDPNNTVVAWAPVADPPGSRIVNYEVIVTDESSSPERVLSAVLPATATSMVVPSAFLLPDGEYKYEVLAIEEGGNRTISEAPFRTAP